MDVESFIHNTLSSCRGISYYITLNYNPHNDVVYIFIHHYVIMRYRWMIRGGFLIRRSSTIHRFFTGFLRCDGLTISEVVSQKNRSRILRKFRPIFIQISSEFTSDFFEKRLHYCTTILDLTNPAKNLRIAELRLMRNPPQVWSENSVRLTVMMQHK